MSLRIQESIRKCRGVSKMERSVYGQCPLGTREHKHTAIQVPACNTAQCITESEDSQVHLREGKELLRSTTACKAMK